MDTTGENAKTRHLVCVKKNLPFGRGNIFSARYALLEQREKLEGPAQLPNVAAAPGPIFRIAGRLSRAANAAVPTAVQDQWIK